MSRRSVPSRPVQELYPQLDPHRAELVEVLRVRLVNEWASALEKNGLDPGQAPEKRPAICRAACRKAAGLLDQQLDEPDEGFPEMLVIEARNTLRRALAKTEPGGQE